jgi:hypothetical protein
MESDLFSLTEQMYFFDLPNSHFEEEGVRNPKVVWVDRKRRRSMASW